MNARITAPSVPKQGVPHHFPKRKKYVENWDELSQYGLGLLLFGGVGTGKTYADGCIANALIDRRISVLFVHMTDVINNRRLSCKPMIITTNISVNAMLKTADLDDRRIYDRILEVCTHIAFNGESFRKSNAAKNLKKAAQYLNGNSRNP